MTKNSVQIKSQSGFTLVELLLVVALMAISFTVTSDILVTIMRSFNKTTVITEVEQHAGVVAQMIEKEIKNAAVVSNPSGNYNRLQFEDTLGNTAYYFYEVYSGIGTLYRYPEGIDISAIGNKRLYAITGNPNMGLNLVGGVRVTCTGNCFVVNVGRPSVVQVNLVFEQAQADLNNAYSGRVVISNTIVVRNTY